MEIVQIVTLTDVRNAEPKTIWYAANTCWWTHRAEHLSILPSSEDEIRRYAEIFRMNSSTPDAPLDEFMERARKAAGGLPCDPRGSVLFTTDNVEGFLSTAEKKSARYGRHGIRAFMAAHHENCIESGSSLRPWSATSWGEYNDAIDRFDAKLKMLAGIATARFDELEREES